jgi:hypothetical protein
MNVIDFVRWLEIFVKYVVDFIFVKTYLKNLDPSIFSVCISLAVNWFLSQQLFAKKFTHTSSFAGM